MRTKGKASWLALLPADPRPWLRESPEPAARWLTLSVLDDPPAEPAAVRRARAACLADPGVQSLAARLPDWDRPQEISGHNSPGFAPNILNLLADHGAGPGDLPGAERLLDQMLARQDPDGRFQTQARLRGRREPAWGALLCDTHAITLALIRFGRGRDPRVQKALACALSDLTATDQGRAWPCRPDPASGFRGPGRKGDCCPLVTLQALRALALAGPRSAGAAALEAARSCLRVWSGRGAAKPYMFGHGRQFKTVKWPPFWYDVLMVLEVLGLYPALWTGPGARPEDRRALAELAACLVAYNMDAQARVIPRSCYQGFADFSFGQKKSPSPWATARLCAVLRPLEDLAPQLLAVEVATLGSSKGGTGLPLLPRSQG